MIHNMIHKIQKKLSFTEVIINKNVCKVYPYFIPGFLMLLPYLIINDPYFIQSYILSFYPESAFQVHLNPNDDRGTVTHRWIVLEKK